MKDYLAQKKKQRQAKTAPVAEERSEKALPVSEIERNFAALFPKEAVQRIDAKGLLEVRMTQAISMAARATSTLFPANMFLEGYDQHSRWFLSSTVLSLVLAD